MSLIKFFWRDFKSDRSFNTFFILCSILGIIGLLLVESFRIGVESKVEQNAKNFIASDLSISTRRSLQPHEIKKIESFISGNKLPYANWLETYSLISKVSQNEEDEFSKLANLNFVSSPFPFFGGVVLETEGEKNSGDWERLHESPKAWISRDLAWELNIKLGDQLKIGELITTVDGIVEQDKFASFRGFNLAPKVFVSYKFMAQTDLVRFGSTTTTNYILKIGEQKKIDEIKASLQKILNDKSIKIIGPKESSEQISRSLSLLTDYLSLITLLTYLLSLVGIYYFTQHFLSKKLKTFSIYKALGLSTKFIFKVNFLHLIVLVLSSVFIASSFLAIILPLLENYFTKLVGEDIYFKLSVISFARILLLSLGGSLLALGPLFKGALETPVAIIFQDLPAELKRIKFVYFIPLFIYILVLAIVLSHSIKVGMLFIGALAIILILSGLLFKSLTIIALKLSDQLNFTNKHAIKTLSRYFTSSFTMFSCLLIGMTLTIFIFQLESSLRKEFSHGQESRRPDLFLFDLQDSQVEKYNALVSQYGWTRTTFSPMIRGRLIKINGVSTVERAEPGNVESSFQTREDQNSERMRNRGVNLSYRSQLSWSEEIVDGAFNGNKCDPEKAKCEISLEQSYARRLGAKLGDVLIFDVSGIEITGIVTSLRTVKWTSFEPNFFILFQPGILEEAPKTYLSSIKVSSFEEKRKVFSIMGKELPSVSMIEVSEVIKKLITVFDLMSFAIKTISFLSLFVALVVLVAVSFNHLTLRKREMGLFYVMGLNNKSIAAVYLREFLMLSGFCFLLSIFFGSALSTLIMKIGFRTDADYRILFVGSSLLIIGIGLNTIVWFKVKSMLKLKGFFGV